MNADMRADILLSSARPVTYDRLFAALAAEIYGWVCRRVFRRVGTVVKSLHSEGKKWI
jgi:hypothetical protein